MSRRIGSPAYVGGWPTTIEPAGSWKGSHASTGTRCVIVGTESFFGGSWAMDESALLGSSAERGAGCPASAADRDPRGHLVCGGDVLDASGEPERPGADSAECLLVATIGPHAAVGGHDRPGGERDGPRGGTSRPPSSLSPPQPEEDTGSASAGPAADRSPPGATERTPAGSSSASPHTPRAPGTRCPAGCPSSR